MFGSSPNRSIGLWLAPPSATRTPELLGQKTAERCEVASLRCIVHTILAWRHLRRFDPTRKSSSDLGTKPAAACRYRGGMRDGLAALDETFLRLRRLWHANHQGLITAKAERIEISSLIVIDVIERGRSRGEEVTVADVAAWSDVAASTASRLVDRAVHNGLVQRLPSQHSHRRVALALTDEGRTLQRQSYLARTQWLAQRVAGWSDSDLQQLAALLGRFADELGLPRVGQPPAVLEPPQEI